MPDYLLGAQRLQVQSGCTGVRAVTRSAVPVQEAAVGGIRSGFGTGEKRLEPAHEQGSGRQSRRDQCPAMHRTETAHILAGARVLPATESRFASADAAASQSAPRANGPAWLRHSRLDPAAAGGAPVCARPIRLPDLLGCRRLSADPRFDRDQSRNANSLVISRIWAYCSTGDSGSSPGGGKPCSALQARGSAPDWRCSSVSTSSICGDHVKPSAS